MATVDTIKLYAKVGVTTYFSEELLKRSAYRLRADSWVWKALLHGARASDLKPLLASEVRSVLSSLQDVGARAEWREIANLPLEKLTMEGVLRCFTILEDCVDARASLGVVSKHSASLRTRALLRRFLEAAGFPKAARINVFFRSRLLLPRVPGRRLISDAPIDLGGSKVPPIGALPHTTIADLRKRTQDVLVGTLDMISAACRETLDEHDQAMARLQEALLEPVSESVVARILDHAATGRYDAKVRAWAAVQPIDELARAYVRVINLHPTLLRRSFSIIRATEISTYLATRLGVDVGKPLASLFLPLWTTMRPLIACLLILQRHTAWNASSVLGLDNGCLTSATPLLELQGFKSKVNKKTPPVLVQESDEDVVRALKYLQARLAFLKRLGWVSALETRLWLNPITARAGRPSEYVEWNGELKNFCNRHNLPRFSLEQMRVQTLAAESVEIGGLETARLRAAHDSIKTTGEYLDHLVLARLHEAVNLEYQQRLEKDVIYLGTGADDTAELALLYPVGDGTSCSNPKSPPFEDYLLDGFCGGINCHEGNGCPNRRIYVDERRVEEAIRVRLYYRNNWERLLDANPEAFNAIHLPGMAFNVALIGVLERGPYAHVVRAACSRLDPEPSHV